MAKPALFAKVLGMPKLKTLIEDIEDLLVAINSGKFVDVEKCQKKCDSILDFLASDPDLSWNITSPSVHVSFTGIFLHCVKKIILCFIFLDSSSSFSIHN